jgi:molybdate transport system substrate-binding protein
MRRAIFPLLLILSAALSGCSGSKPVEEKVRRSIAVAAASDLRYAMPALLEEFYRAHPEVVVEVTYGSSGNFFAQISNGAPFDLFFSADLSYPTKLVDAGLAEKGSLSLYAIGRIVLWVRKESAIDLDQQGMQALLGKEVRQIAIANPRHAPYGRAAESALAHLGLLEPVRDKLVLGENVAQAAQLVESSAADCGIIAYSLAVASPLADRGRFLVIPTDSYPPLEQASVLLKRSTDPAAARLLQQFMDTPAARQVMRQYGFDDPRQGPTPTAR